MKHTLRNQLRYAVFSRSNLKLGESKHAYMKQHGYKSTRGRIYSVNMTKRLLDTINSFSKFMKINYPAVKKAIDIENSHYQHFVDERATQWTRATAVTMVDNLHTIDVLISKTFKCNVREFTVKVPEKVKCDDIRTIAMDEDDFYRLLNYMYQKHPKMMGIRALEIAYRSGLRVSEIAGLKYTDIDIDRAVIQVREGAKNGKYRDVPIPYFEDLKYYSDLRNECEEYYRRTENPYVCRGVKADSLNDAIRRKGLNELGLGEKYPNTTIHAIRKLYAGNRMQALQEDGYSEKDAWKVVVKELGHEDDGRKELFRTYVHRNV